MKKLAIMFVMLLGSVATMQAQSNTTFNFSCETVNPLDLDGNGFTVAEETMLSEATFNAPNPVNPGIYLREYANTDHGDGTFSYTNVWIHAVDGGFQARGGDGFPDTTRDTLAELIAFLDAFDFYSL